MNLWTAALTTMLGLIVALPVLADGEGHYHGPGMMWDGGWGMMVFGPLMMILFVAAIVVLVVLALRWLGGSGHLHADRSGNGRTSPLDILQERLAKGEIDVAEYEERRRALGA
jgi:putative membrane protein